jgi:hypothetical protein
MATIVASLLVYSIVRESFGETALSVYIIHVRLKQVLPPACTLTLAFEVVVACHRSGPSLAAFDDVYDSDELTHVHLAAV